jgi:hypothetical protein
LACIKQASNWHFTGDERYGEGQYDYCHHCTGPFEAENAAVAGLHTRGPQLPQAKTRGPEALTDCAMLKFSTFTLEWRESFAKVWYDGKLVAHWSPENWLDHCRSNNLTSLPWFYNSIEWIRQELFVALTACVMANAPVPRSGVDASPQYFAVDYVRVCKNDDTTPSSPTALRRPSAARKVAMVGIRGAAIQTFGGNGPHLAPERAKAGRANKNANWLTRHTIPMHLDYSMKTNDEQDGAGAAGGSWCPRFHTISNLYDPSGPLYDETSAPWHLFPDGCAPSRNSNANGCH